MLLQAGRSSTRSAIALAAAMGHGSLPVRRKPRVAILATGDELVLPGEHPGPDQIAASSLPALLAWWTRPARRRSISASRGTRSNPSTKGSRGEAGDADILVTLGGASVGDHDLVQQALSRQGMQLGFWRVALRPGKTSDAWQARRHDACSDLPGNPVSSLVCAILFLVPAIRALQGHADAGSDPTEAAILGADLPANGDRQDYMRAMLSRFRGAGSVATASRRCRIRPCSRPGALRCASRAERLTRLRAWPEIHAVSFASALLLSLSRPHRA